MAPAPAPAATPSAAILLERDTLAASTLVTLAGELDLAQRWSLDRAFASLSDRAPNLVVDLHRVAFMDCSVLRVLVAAHERAVDVGGRLTIVGARRMPLRLLHDTGLHRVFRLRETLDAVSVEEG